MEEANLSQPSGSGRAYSEADIKVLNGPEAIRKRPGMYIGSTGPLGLRFMLLELVNLAVDEVTRGPGRSVAVELHKDGSATVRDDGPGFSIEPGADVSAVEMAMTRLHCSSRSLGIGLPALNALSSSVEVQVHRSGFLWRQQFARGETVSPLERLGPTRETGTSFTFRPDPEIFAGATFDAGPIVSRLEELAALNPEIRFEFRDDRAGQSEVWQRPGGLVNLVRDLNRGRETLHEPIAFKGRAGKAEFRFAFQYHKGYETDLRAFANQSRMDEPLTHVGAVQRYERSAHVIGFLRALRHVLCPVLRSRYEPTRRVRLLDGLTAAVSIRLKDPMYMGACRTRLGNPEAESMAFSIAYLRLFAHFEDHPEIARRIRDQIAADS